MPSAALTTNTTASAALRPARRASAISAAGTLRYSGGADGPHHAEHRSGRERRGRRRRGEPRAVAATTAALDRVRHRGGGVVDVDPAAGDQAALPRSAAPVRPD